MNQVLGLVDTLEAKLLEAKKIPFSENIVVNEKEILVLIDKIRIALKSDGEVVQESIDRTKESASKTIDEVKMMDLAEKKAEDIKKGANAYADNVLSNLQLTVTKLQSQLAKLEQSIDTGREVLDKTNYEETNDEPNR